MKGEYNEIRKVSSSHRCVSVGTALLYLCRQTHILCGVNFTDYMPSAGGSGQMKTKLYIGWGHHFPVDSFVKAEDFEKDCSS